MLQKIETNTYRAFLPFNTPIRKTVFFALSGTRTHVSLITSRVLGPVWGYRGKDTLPSEEKLGSGDPHAAKSPR